MQLHEVNRRSGLEKGAVHGAVGGGAGRRHVRAGLRMRSSGLWWQTMCANLLGSEQRLSFLSSSEYRLSSSIACVSSLSLAMVEENPPSMESLVQDQVAEQLAPLSGQLTSIISMLEARQETSAGKQLVLPEMEMGSCGWRSLSGLHGSGHGTQVLCVRWQTGEH